MATSSFQERRLDCAAMTRTFLTVAFREKDAAKALGARWDGTERRWYVPDGLELAQFAAWLPAQAGAVAKTSSLLPATDAAPAQRGIPLSQLLNGVARTVAAAYGEGVWTTAEVLRVSARGGHVYLELSERSADGGVVAKAQAAIWSRTAERIIPEFEQATGAILSAGIKLMVRARPVFKAQFGFSLEIDGIDPAYTLGDLEAKKREIRERLRREGLFEMNKSLAPPWDFLHVMVVSPEAAAGHGAVTPYRPRVSAALRLLGGDTGAAQKRRCSRFTAFGLNNGCAGRHQPEFHRLTLCGLGRAFCPACRRTK